MSKSQLQEMEEKRATELKEKEAKMKEKDGEIKAAQSRPRASWRS